MDKLFSLVTISLMAMLTVIFAVALWRGDPFPYREAAALIALCLIAAIGWVLYTIDKEMNK